MRTQNEALRQSATRTPSIRLRDLVVLGLFVLAMAALEGCGNSRPPFPFANAGTLSGNWQMTLTPHCCATPETFTGFMIQSGTSLNGNLILGFGCPGVGAVSGSVSGQNLALTIDEFGQDISLSGTAFTNGTLSGSYSTLAGGCDVQPSTGSFTAVQVKAISGSFHGTFSGQTNGPQTVSGTLNQGANVGGSTATLTGSLNATSSGPCPYLTKASLRGVISGTSISLNIYGPSGTLIGQIPSTVAAATIAPDASAMSGGYVFSSQSSNCSGDLGTFQITFP